MGENEIGTVKAGTEYYEDFLVDNVLSFADGTADIHFHLYVPESYDGTEDYALYLALPGYGSYYFQGVAKNLRDEHFAAAGKRYNDKMIIAAPQPDDWGQTSMKQTIGLTEYLLKEYRIDGSQVFITGYSGGGETLSLSVSERPDLYAAALHVSSQWDGNLESVAEKRVPVYIVIGEKDEYYGSSPAQKAYDQLVAIYRKKGLSEDIISSLVVLDLKDQNYFTSHGMSNQHGGGSFIADDEKIMGWLFSH